MSMETRSRPLGHVGAICYSSCRHYAIGSLFSANGYDAYWYRRGHLVGDGRVYSVGPGVTARPGVLVGDDRVCPWAWVKRVVEFANMSDEELRRYLYGNRGVRPLGHVGAICLLVVGASAIGSLFQLMGRDTAYWYRRGRGCLWAMAGYIRGPSNRGLFCWRQLLPSPTNGRCEAR